VVKLAAVGLDLAPFNEMVENPTTVVEENINYHNFLLSR